MNKLSKVLIVIIIVIALLVGALGYYTYFVYDDNKETPSNDIEIKKGELELAIDNNILKFPYARIVDKKISYDELNRAYMVGNAWDQLNVSYEHQEKQYSSNLKLIKDIDEVKYLNYNKNTSQYIAKMLGLSVAEITNIDLEFWNKIMGGNSNFYILDGITLKEKIKELYGYNDSMFDNSFVVNKEILGNLDGVVSTDSIMYDKSIDKVVMHTDKNTGGITRKVYIISNEIVNDAYKVKFVEGYLEEGTTYTLKTNDENDVTVDITGEKEAIINEALKNNQDKLDKYEITFKKSNNKYQYSSIEKLEK